jgi:hypothetical protein
MMTFENFLNFNMNCGDHVMIKYKDSKYFLKTGKIVSVRKEGAFAGDCSVELDFTREIVDFYYTNLLKIVEIIEQETGEIFRVTFSDFHILTEKEYIKYDTRGFYFFNNEHSLKVKTLTL